MTESQRRAFSRQSETRQALNILQRADEPNGEAIEKARREFDESEIEVRAALATDDDEVIEESEIDAEVRERSEIRSRARVAAYIAAAADQQPLRTVIDIRLPSASRRSPFSAASGARHTAR